MTTRLHIEGLRRDVEEPEEVVRERAASKLGVSDDDIAQLTILKRSLDARGRPRFMYNVEVELDAPPAKLPRGVRLAESGPRGPRHIVPRRKERVAVVGAGPAGLFCARRLAEAGLEPVLIDRGEPVEIRGRHVSGLMHRGELKPDSNICFGEGGAGTWSDGKLYTRVSDYRVRHVLETIVELGGPERILIDAKPHLGTDKLVALCKAFRARLIEADCEVRFSSFVEGLEVERAASGDRVTAVKLRGGERVEVDRVVLAVGHSAREMYHWLEGARVHMVPKPFAVGFRVEHPQSLINAIQYGEWAETKALPTADYRLAANFNKNTPRHRGVYSFCMCPGGQVVPSSTLEGGVCVNGMSHASRKGHWANSALVVSVKPEDFGAFGVEVEGPLGGLAFQEEAERRAWELAGGGFIAPAQRLSDYKAGRVSSDVRKTTYKPGIASADLTGCYPEFVTAHLREALDRFERRMPGFVTQDALLIGVETRTSSPVQVVRDDETLESVSLGGLYPCGEGAGYGGGIVSAALDGLRIAERILDDLAEAS
jgi:hypothetical protein